MLRCVCLALVGAVILYGQSFDVAAIHPHDPANPHFRVKLPNHGQFSAVGAVGKLLVMIAYGVQDSQIAGGPDWFATEKWDIEAKCDDDRHSEEETTRMVRNLLEERFALKIHRESEQRPVYALVVGNGGPKFKASEKNSTTVHVGTNAILLQRGNMGSLSGLLATAAGRPVIDRTGLEGLYDLYVQWDDAPVREGGLPGANTTVSSDADRGSIFTAVQDQLGLRLESQRAPVEVLAIDRANRPSSN